jgi:hypothetical protein
VKSWRVLLTELSVDGVLLEIDYADVFVVVREGADGPADTDWEVNLTSRDRVRVEPGRHGLHACSADGQVLRGDAALRFSDGRRHLFRGDGALDGVARLLA